MPGRVADPRVPRSRGKREYPAAVRGGDGADRAAHRRGGAEVIVLIADFGLWIAESNLTGRFPIHNRQSAMLYNVDLFSSRFGVPEGFPLIAPAVAFVVIQSPTVADGAFPKVAL